MLVSWGGLKGAVPLLLAAYAGLEALPETERTEAIVLVATAASILGPGRDAPARRVTGARPGVGFARYRPPRRRAGLPTTEVTT